LDSFVFAAVLFAAACHAGWNTAIKIGGDTVSATALIAVGAGIFGVALMPFVGLPLAAAWSWLITSVIIHLFYFIGLSEVYRVGDLGQVYPLARGAAPLMTAILSVPLVGEAIGPLGWGGILALAGGVFLLSIRGGRALARLDAHATGLALFTAITICAYSLVDGIGARLAGSANAYTACLFVANGIVLAAYGVVRLRGKVFAAMVPYWATGLAGGGLQFVSYGIAIWAMTVAPIAIVAALRETSVLFGAVLAVVFLKEPLRPSRIAAAVMIVLGLFMIRLR
jgi:drug/metabolite transporter (DMT)-like permease